MVLFHRCRMDRTLWTSGMRRLNLPLPVDGEGEPLPLLPSPIQQRLATTISAALAIASKTTWSHWARGPDDVVALVVVVVVVVVAAAGACC